MELLKVIYVCAFASPVLKPERSVSRGQPPPRFGPPRARLTAPVAGALPVSRALFNTLAGVAQGNGDSIGMVEGSANFGSRIFKGAEGVLELRRIFDGGKRFDGRVQGD